MFGFTQELSERTTSDAEIPEQLAADALPPPGRACWRSSGHDDPDSTLGWCDDQVEFEFGLDLILDGLERVAS